VGTVTLSGVSKTYGDGTVAVSNLDLHVDDGEFVVLVGSSGCGKTTSLRMIAGLEAVSSGSIEIASVVMCHAAQGDKGASHYGPEEIARIRAVEAERAAEIAGAEHATLGIPDDEVLAADREQLRMVIDLIRRSKPDVIITHHPNDYHTDHLEISKLVFNASYLATSPLTATDEPPYPLVTPLYFMETVAGVGFSPTEFVDTSDVIEMKIAMLEAHESQMTWVREYHGVDFIDQARTTGRYRGHQCGVDYAEGFIPCLTWLRATTHRVLP